jgi:uncharacterized membrane protein YdfJ with MMPL/SSD domain
MRSKALLLAAVAIATLALASPAVARPSVRGLIYPHTLSAATMITVVCLALAVAIALVTGLVLASRRRLQVQAEETAAGQLQAPRIKKVSRQRQAVV